MRDIILRSAATLLFLACVGGAVAAQPCRSQNPADYAREKFVVGAVSITSEDPIFGSMGAKVNNVLSTLPLHAGGAFNETDLKVSTGKVITELVKFDLPATVYIPLPRVVFEDCDTNSTPKTVKVSFVLTFTKRTREGSPAPSQVYEKAEPSAPVVNRPSRLNRFLSIVNLQPYVGFTGGQNLAGAGSTINLKNGLLQSLELEGAGSSSSAVGAASVRGSRTFDSALFRNLEWRGGYDYSRLPAADSSDIKRGTGYAQLFATTRPFGGGEDGNGLVFRYGVSLEGGNRQTDLNPASATDVASGSYESLKGYFGGSWRVGPHVFKSSYGLQLGGTDDGSSASGRRVDYLKHIFDTAYRVRFFPWSNKPVSFESQFTAGRIERRGQLPLAERFFGGNIDQNFIAGDDWQIRGAPYIRSFRGQRLSTGGDRFVSFNNTLALTVWARPAVPREALAELPAAFEILRHHPDAQGVRIALTTLYAFENPVYIEQIAKADYEPLKKELTNLQTDLEDLQAQGLGEATAKMVVDCASNVEEGLDIIEEAKGKSVFRPDGTLTPIEGLDARFDLKQLVVGFPDLKKKESTVELITKALDDILKQPDAALDPFRQRLKDHRDKLPPLAEPLKERYQAFVENGEPAVLKQVDKFFDDMQSQIGRLGREVNTASAGPVFMFDAARVRSRGLDEKFRYGVGLGLQFEFFGVQLRGGYSFNPDRRPGEARGAVTFSFDVSDILQ